MYNIGYHLIWCPKYRVESVGHISEETIRKYIEDQKGK
ncbi:MAG: hypothetical protein BSOLF_1032 [Candidatus Carbobacillus altaicus]|uniref:Uncharacterized protein n=1 Tax=Candidatus Carbonibacillus altaicus TaxID=2163959 RepID=A0A2R6XX79_9BACL|nr:MAG: hypothetical protein BSOLF_1032 [Candidatus Carbobacillus altaicus]